MSARVRMPFGKHRGKLLADVPFSYLAWCLRSCDNLDPWSRQAIKYGNEHHAPVAPPPVPRRPRNPAGTVRTRQLCGWYNGTGAGQAPRTALPRRLVTLAEEEAMAKQPTYKDSDLSFDFGYNVKPKKAKGGGAKQSKTTKQAFAMARRKGGPLHGQSGS